MRLNAAIGAFRSHPRCPDQSQSGFLTRSCYTLPGKGTSPRCVAVVAVQHSTCMVSATSITVDHHSARAAHSLLLVGSQFSFRKSSPSTSIVAGRFTQVGEDRLSGIAPSLYCAHVALWRYPKCSMTAQTQIRPWRRGSPLSMPNGRWRRSQISSPFQKRMHRRTSRFIPSRRASDLPGCHECRPSGTLMVGRTLVK